MGRPSLDAATVRTEYEAAVAWLRERGQTVTVAKLAEHLGISERALRERRARFDLR